MQALHSYRLLVTWQAMRKKAYLPLMIVVQTLFAFGIVAGYPLLFPSVDRTTILYLATGAPAISLITMGLVAVPQLVAEAKTEGTLAYMRSLPVPRLAYLMADMTVWLVIVLPGVMFAVVVGALRFGLDLQVSPLVVPAVMLVALTATAVGYALASLLPTMVAHMLSQVLIVFVLMFSPLNFPADRLPGWLAAIHSVLPIQAMGEALRGTLAPNQFALPPGAFLTLAVWCVLGFTVTYAAMTRRA
jgi:ABC-2 type transport system permease protein